MENSSKCVRVVTFEGLSASKWSLFVCLDRWCLLRLGFEQIFEFLTILGDPSVSHFGAHRCKKQGLENIAKNVRKRALGWGV